MVPPIGRRASDVALRFASPRKGALGREVSDELTVPLCSFTQHEVHFGDEAAWWQRSAFDAAGRFWLKPHWNAPTV
jgi:hypothetical protein